MNAIWKFLKNFLKNQKNKNFLIQIYSNEIKQKK